jgi:bifunctional ADP-heptose synthase (sugar kinase/adenylyltransferase)
MSDAARVANVAGGVKVTKRGTATVSAYELLRGLETVARESEQR